MERINLEALKRTVDIVQEIEPTQIRPSEAGHHQIHFLKVYRKQGMLF